jgi:hypothetical protein
VPVPFAASVSGIRYSVFGIRYSVSGTQHLVSGRWALVVTVPIAGREAAPVRSTLMALATNGPLTPGTIFAGDYEIVAPRKTGGMGVVYEARQLSTGQLRALKATFLPASPSGTK